MGTTSVREREKRNSPTSFNVPKSPCGKICLRLGWR